MDKHHYTERLLDERIRLEREMATLGKPSEENATDWELSPIGLDIMEADRNEAADRVEETQTDQSVLDSLETQYRLVLHAQTRLAEGTYGICEVCETAIEEERLNANPAARTCIAHREQESSLPL